MSICVTQAIEKALTDLVTKGIDKGLWAQKAA
jgi:curli production assembly/transport component CsgG